MTSPAHSSQRPRVVSLLPSATEILALLGAKIVGRSHECDWPPAVRSAPALTGAYNQFVDSRQMHDAVTETMRQGRGLYTLDEQTLAAVRPDIIITQSLCSVCAVDLDIVRQAAQRLDPPPRVVDTNPQNLHDVIADVARLGAELGPEAEGTGAEAAAALQGRVDAAVAAAKRLAEARNGAGAPPPRVVFIEWVAPLFPGGHWTPQMIEMAGGCCPINPPTRPGGGALPSAEMPHSRVVEADPDLVIVAPCGLDLDTTRREVQEQLAHEDWWRGLRAVRQGRVALVDGNQHFNRPGPRLVDALEWLVGWVGAGGRREHVAASYPQPEGFPWEQLAPLEQEEQQAGAGPQAGEAEAHGVQGAAM